MTSRAQSWTMEALQQDTYLSESLTLANSFAQLGNADQAVKLTGEALLYLLRNSLPLTEEKLEKLRQLRRIGVGLEQNGFEVQLAYYKQSFNILEASTFLRLFFDLLDHEKKATVFGQWARLCKETTVTWLDKVRDSFYLDLGGVERIQLCRTLAAMKQAVAIRPEGYKNYFTNHCQQLSMLLREPLQRTVQIAKRNRVEMDIVEHRRNRRRSYREISQYRKLFRWRRKQDYLAQLNNDKRSRIVAAFHFGDFIHALHYFADHGVSDRHRLVLRYQVASTNHRANAAIELGNRQLLRASQVLSHEADPLGLVASLRRGNTSLTIFCDLPREHGEVVEVSFLGRRAWFPKGPAVIALLSKAPLLPFITYNDGDYNIIEINSLLEPDIQAGESFHQAVQRLTQHLISFMEKHLRRFPEQWRYLNQLPSYFVAEYGVDRQ